MSFVVYCVKVSVWFYWMGILLGGLCVSRMIVGFGEVWLGYCLFF